MAAARGPLSATSRMTRPAASMNEIRGSSMALACNINRKGRWVRGISGGVLLMAAVVLAGLGWPASGGVRWTLVIGVGLLGGFQVFEALAGWCVVKALGGKTPI